MRLDTWLKQTESKPICRPLAGNTKLSIGSPEDEILNPKQDEGSQMTEPEADLKKCYLKKQSQFAEEVNWLNASNNNGIWRFRWAEAAIKQSQFKPKRRPLDGKSSV